MPKQKQSARQCQAATRERELWDLWLDGGHAPALNMALDDSLLESAPERGRPLLRFYSWDRPAVSIGYVQRYDAAPSDAFAVVRRPTGGGVVYHDHDLTYSVVIPAGHWLTTLNRTYSYDWINRAVQDGLTRCSINGELADNDIPRSVDRNTMVCFSNPTRYDILLGSRKIAGSAQRRRTEGILHQGSIHFGGPLPVARETLITTIREGFESVLKANFEPFQAASTVLNRAERLASQIYNTDAWNRRR